MSTSKNISAATEPLVVLIAPVQHGGVLSFIKHLRDLVKPFIFAKSAERTEKSTRFMRELEYLNVSKLELLESAKEGRKTLISFCHNAEPSYVEFACELLKFKNVSMVIHDPRGMEESFIESSNKYGSKLIAMREKGYAIMLKEVESKALIPMPYVRHIFNAKAPMHNACSATRFEFVKQPKIVLDANLLLKEQGKEIIHWYGKRGGRTAMALHGHPMLKETYVGEFVGSVVPEYACAVDMSSPLIGDGGGVQYSFLEAMDAERLLIINKKWAEIDGEMVSGFNCLAVGDHYELASLCSLSIAQLGELSFGLKEGYLKTLSLHSDGVKEKWMEVLG